MPSVATSIERLAAALRHVNLASPQPPASDPCFANVASAISPWRLPDSLVELWTRLDPSSMRAYSSPPVHFVDFVLEAWVDDTANGLLPRGLFPVCYESHAFYVAELSRDNYAGGAMYYAAYGASSFQLAFADVTDYVELLAVAVEQRAGERIEDGDDSYFMVDQDFWETAAADRLTSAPHPLYGSSASFLRAERHTWPSHWTRSR